MHLKEAVTFWTNHSSSEFDADETLAIDWKSIPGWVIALRRPSNEELEPYVEIWTEEDFITETQIHQSESGTEKVKVRNAA
jgi:hypothetical protein